MARGHYIASFMTLVFGDHRYFGLTVLMVAYGCCSYVRPVVRLRPC